MTVATPTASAIGSSSAKPEWVNSKTSTTAVIGAFTVTETNAAAATMANWPTRAPGQMSSHALPNPAPSQGTGGDGGSEPSANGTAA